MTAAKLLKELESLLKEEKLRVDQKKELRTTSKTVAGKKPTNFDERSTEKKIALQTTTKPSIERNEQQDTLVLKRLKESETKEKKSKVENVVVEVEQHGNDCCDCNDSCV